MIKTVATCDLCGTKMERTVIVLDSQQLTPKQEIGFMPALFMYPTPTRHFCNYECAAKWMHYAGFLK